MFKQETEKVFETSGYRRIKRDSWRQGRIYLVAWDVYLEIYCRRNSIWLRKNLHTTTLRDNGWTCADWSIVSKIQFQSWVLHGTGQTSDKICRNECFVFQWRLRSRYLFNGGWHWCIFVGIIDVDPRLLREVTKMLSLWGNLVQWANKVGPLVSITEQICKER